MSRHGDTIGIVAYARFAYAIKVGRALRLVSMVSDTNLTRKQSRINAALNMVHVHFLEMGLDANKIIGRSLSNKCTLTL